MIVTDLIPIGAGYFFISGVAHTQLERAIIGNCIDCHLNPETGKWEHYNHKRYGADHVQESEYIHGFMIFWGGMLWPLTLPYMLGKSMDWYVRRDHKRRREILEAIHRRNVAKIEADITAKLDRQLNAGTGGDTIEDRTGGSERGEGS